MANADGKHPGADAAFFQRREFCFTLENDIFVRYQSFKASTWSRARLAMLNRRGRPQRGLQSDLTVENRSDNFGAVLALQNGAELASALCARLPAKIDIGPVYSADPQQRKTYGGRMMLRCSCAASAWSDEGC